jgi:hypothetical protein
MTTTTTAPAITAPATTTAPAAPAPAAPAAPAKAPAKAKAPRKPRTPKAKAPAKAPAKAKAAPAGLSPLAKAALTAATKAGQQPGATLFGPGKPYPVHPGSHRGYAQAVAAALATAMPKGYTLAQLRAALVACVAAYPGHTPPNCGWGKHNMPTWGAGQGWWKPVGKVAA